MGYLTSTIPEPALDAVTYEKLVNRCHETEYDEFVYTSSHCQKYLGGHISDIL